MQSRVLKTLAAAALVAATSVAAQPAPQPSNSNDSAARMILQLQQMREEIRELRGQVEAQSVEIENLARRQRDQYLDLDRRIQSTSQGRPVDVASPGSGSGMTPDNGIPTNQFDSRPQPAISTRPSAPAPQPQIGTVTDAPEVRPELDTSPEIVTLDDPGEGPVRQLREPTAAEQDSYDQAFLALRETRYADAAEGFDGFLNQYPNSAYAPNALYWLGEVYYVTRDFETALAQFQTLMQRYPESGKQADALLKTGFSLFELGQWDRARAALEQVLADFPGTNYSRLAENRLRTMRLEGHL